MTQTTATPQVQRQQQRPQRGTNTMAILSLVFAFLFWPLGIILGVIANMQVARTGQPGSGLAKAGLILSIIFGILAVVIFVVR